MEVDVSRSRALARRIEAVNKSCWWNAVKGMRYIASRRSGLFAVKSELWYVEGFANGLVPGAEHGWIEMDGRIVDPTPVWCGLSYRESWKPATYFPGRRFSVAELNVLRPVELPVSRMLREPAYREAHMQAMETLFPTYRSFLTTVQEAG